MAIPESFIEEVIARSDIVDVVSEYVHLTKRSGANQFGLCPFHSEKTPSFSVAPDKQIYHCFGCGKGGNVIGFIMEIENLTFRDAVAFLARRAHMEMPEDGEDRLVRDRRARIFELNRQAARWFYDNLSKPEGAPAVEYIRKRALSKRTVTSFGLGAAPDDWYALTNEMRRRGYSDAELIEAGLAKKGRNGGAYDVFRNRLVFPVIDVRGNVVAFSGRTLGDDGGPKYLNTPDTPVYAKSRNLFALNLAKRSKRDMFILAEGNVDVVMLHQAGFDCAVASLGTSLTAEQARLMKNYKEKVVIAYDSDGAGLKAAQRAIGILEPAGLQVRVLRMEGAKDPDEFIKARGPDAFQVLLEQSANHVEYRILAAKSKYDMDTDDGRLAFLREAVEILAENPNRVERELYTARVAHMVGVSKDAARVEVEKAVKNRAYAEKRQRERQTMRLDAGLQPRDRKSRYENLPSARAEEGVIRLLMADPELARYTGGLTSAEFTAPFLGRIYDRILKRAENHESVSPAVIAAGLEPGEAAQFTELLREPEELSTAREALANYIDKIRESGLYSGTNRDVSALYEMKKKKMGHGG